MANRAVVYVVWKEFFDGSLAVVREVFADERAAGDWKENVNQRCPTYRVADMEFSCEITW